MTSISLLYDTSPNTEETIGSSKDRKSANDQLKVKLWPLMAFAARKVNCTGAYRLWVLAKALDIHGSGVIKAENLREWAIAIGNPFGFVLDKANPTVTIGVVSAFQRDFESRPGERIYKAARRQNEKVSA